jgi:hypothetical protein
MLQKYAIEIIIATEEIILPIFTASKFTIRNYYRIEDISTNFYQKNTSDRKFNYNKRNNKRIYMVVLNLKNIFYILKHYNTEHSSNFIGKK